MHRNYRKKPKIESVVQSERYKTCPRCNGEKPAYKTCPRCKGTGIIRRRKKSAWQRQKGINQKPKGRF